MLDQVAHNASTVMNLVAGYRRAVSDLVALVQRPQEATRERNLARAIAFVHEHFAEPLEVRKVAHIAGFAPGYFSQLFKRHEHMTFESYVRKLRVRRAQQLLKGTDLSAERISQLCGFALEALLLSRLQGRRRNDAAPVPSSQSAACVASVYLSRILQRP